jgi:hypothetical protein
LAALANSQRRKRRLVSERPPETAKATPHFPSPIPLHIPAGDDFEPHFFAREELVFLVIRAPHQFFILG